MKHGALFLMLSAATIATLPMDGMAMDNTQQNTTPMNRIAINNILLSLEKQASENPELMNKEDIQKINQYQMIAAQDGDVKTLDSIYKIPGVSADKQALSIILNNSNENGILNPLIATLEKHIFNADNLRDYDFRGNTIEFMQ